MAKILLALLIIILILSYTTTFSVRAWITKKYLEFMAKLHTSKDPVLVEVALKANDAENKALLEAEKHKQEADLMVEKDKQLHESTWKEYQAGIEKGTHYPDTARQSPKK